jgi:CheY-like chemotaxis protein
MAKFPEPWKIIQKLGPEKQQVCPISGLTQPAGRSASISQWRLRMKDGRARSRTATAMGEPTLRLAGVPVLVVDPQARSAHRTETALRAAGALPRVARDAEEALFMVDAFLPRAIVLDLVLPRLSGLVLAQAIIADETTRNVVIIALTAFGGPDAERVARQAGCAASAAKSISPARLVGLLVEHLRGDA